MQEIRNILLVDDHDLFRSGLKLLLSNSKCYRVVAEASNGLDMMDYLADNHQSVDVVMLDISMPVMDGVEAATKAMQLYPDLKIITLSMYGEQDYYLRMMGAEVKGFLLKNSSIAEVTEALDTVMAGGSYFSEELLDGIINSLRYTAFNRPAKEEITDDEPILSEREVEVLMEICTGLTNSEIADKLFISKRTVDKHRANIMEKTGCKNTANIVVYAIKNNLIEI